MSLGHDPEVVIRWWCWRTDHISTLMLPLFMASGMEQPAPVVGSTYMPRFWSMIPWLMASWNEISRLVRGSMTPLQETVTRDHGILVCTAVYENNKWSYVQWSETRGLLEKRWLGRKTGRKVRSSVRAIKSCTKISHSGLETRLFNVFALKTTPGFW